MTDQPDEPQLGAHDLDLPFEEVPGGPFSIDQEAHLAGGVTVAAMVIPDVPGHGPAPALRFTFIAPNGTHYPPFMLITDADQLEKLKPLVYAAVNAAIKAAKEARRG